MARSIVPISKHLDRKVFDCGVPQLNKYLYRFALPNDKKNIGKTFVFIDDAEPTRPIGYYTLSMAQVQVDDIPDEIRKGLPRYPIPAMRLCRLAVDTAFQGAHVGSTLLLDVFQRALTISNEVALRFVLVDAIDESAKAFYQHYGFVAFKAYPLTLVLPVETIRAAGEA